MPWTREKNSLHHYIFGDKITEMIYPYYFETKISKKKKLNVPEQLNKALISAKDDFSIERAPNERSCIYFKTLSIYIYIYI